MPRYKDIDAILKKLPDDLPYKASVKRVLMQAPEADVVPRSEVEELKKAYAIYEEITGLKQAKQEVARDIFKEILNIIRGYEFDALTANESYGVFLVRNFGSEILKLKKKYTEGTDGKQA
jgi:hypothetical protein